jgi:hypothetical protein
VDTVGCCRRVLIDLPSDDIDDLCRPDQEFQLTRIFRKGSGKKPLHLA